MLVYACGTDIIMEKPLNHIVKKLRRPPRLLTKYVDDNFAGVNENEVRRAPQMLNSFEKYIKFTFEMEEDGKLSYMDSGKF